MNNKEILKNVLVTFGLLTTSIVALFYFNTKLTENSSKQGFAIAPAASIHQYIPTSSSSVTNASVDQGEMFSTTASAVVFNTTDAVKASNYSNNPLSMKPSNYSNNLVRHASTDNNATVVGDGANMNMLVAPKSNIAQQRKQMQMSSLAALSSRRLTSITSTPVAKTTQQGEPFQESTEVPGTISRKDFPVDPEEPFPDEETPLGSGLLVLGVCALGYTLKQKLSKVN